MFAFEEENDRFVQSREFEELKSLGFWFWFWVLTYMADALSVIPSAVLRNLADKLYEKRKNAALEVCIPTSSSF